jgi:hypothetical protein
MPKPARQLFAGTCAIVLGCVATSALGKGSEEMAARLLRISEIHVIYAEGIAAGYRSGALKARRPEIEVNCFVTKVNPELVLPALVNAYSSEFSDNELRLAITFFESKTGRNYVRYQRIKSRHIFGTSTEKEPEFPPPEVERINAFAETRIGNLILRPNSPMSALAKEKLGPQFLAFRDLCRSAQ